ncbi:tetraspanin-8-like isoform X2 [Genypterus blacodes]|uniref:tetraspanin-8-like isoform X2 n=1 Tax=Genypterus blacodes TaxID=154954 RepID=UPI003F75C37D
MEFTVISSVLLATTLFSHGYLYEDEELSNFPVLHVMYTMSILSLPLAIIGIYGASKEKKWALILFTVGMILGSLIVFTFIIFLLSIQNLIAETVEHEYLNLMPFNNASRFALNDLEHIQAEFHCCGVQQGYQDWGYNISESCLCKEDSTNPCVAAPKNSSLFDPKEGDQHVMIYEEPCITFLVFHVILVLNIMVVVMLGITVFWVSTVALCITILCHLKRKVDVPTVVYSPEAKAGNYSPLTDPADCT